MPVGQYLSDKFLAIYGLAGSLVSTVFLSPPKYVWGLCGAVVAGASLGLFLSHRFVESEPN
jgi:hypothetical protein